MPPRRNTATPRATRANQRTPLPAVPSAPSFAYGAPGKAELRTQVRASGRDFGEGFEAARQASAEPESIAEAAEEEDEEVDASSVAPPSETMDGNRRVTRRAPSAPVEKKATRETPQAAARRRAEPEPQPEPEAEPEPQVESAPSRAETERIATDLDAGARYQPAQREEVAERPEPSKTRVFRRFFPRYIRALFAPADDDVKGHTTTPLEFWLSTIFAVVTFFVIYAYIPLPAKMAANREDFIWGLKTVLRIDPYGMPPRQFQEMWYRIEHDHIFSRDLPDYNVPEAQFGININFLRRLEKVEARMTGLEDDMRLHKETMAEIQGMLPSHLVVQYIDGQLQIPEAFWSALQERLVSKSDMAPLWQAFIARSESQIQEYWDEAVDSKLQSAIEANNIITASHFTQLMSEKYEQLSEWSRNELRSIQSDNLVEMKEIAAGAASEVVKQYPQADLLKTQLGKLAMMTELYNWHSKISETNWFSIGLGARVDPKYTSATDQPKSPGWFQGFLQTISPLHVSKYPAVMALKPWQEPTDCWCASLETYGYAQIHITLPQKIYPDKFTIEHIPATGTRDIASAPREFEVWADIGDVNIARQINQNNEQHYTFGLDHPCGRAPEDTYVCILSNSYDIHASNWIQRWSVNNGMDGLQDSKDAGIRASKFTVKVTSNYGANHTCLYRFRMSGEKVEFATAST